MDVPKTTDPAELKLSLVKSSTECALEPIASVSVELWALVDEVPVYEVSTHGNVRRIGSTILRKLLRNTAGYQRIILTSGKLKVTRVVHRLVANAFIPNTENKPFVNHINGLRADNNIKNLEWCTAKENANRKIFPTKSQNGRPIIQLNTDGSFVKEWPTGVKAAQALNLRQGDISSACRRKNGTSGGWRWVYRDDYAPINSTEEWKVVLNTPQLVGCMVSNLGRIKYKNGRITLGTNQNGYMSVKGILRVHCIVALAFCVKRDGCDIVNHRDGNKTNNMADNLEFVTKSGNAQHAVDTGLNSRIRAVRQICKDGNNSFKSIAEASRLTGICTTSIKKACDGIIKHAGGYKWEYLVAKVKTGLQYSVSCRAVRQTAEGIDRVYISISEASRVTGIPPISISRVCRGKQHSAGGFRWYYNDAV